MPIKETITHYRCSVCGEKYLTMTGAERCERKTKTHDDVEVGDRCLITGGQSSGKHIKVDEVWYARPEWAGKRYHHTVVCAGQIEGSPMSRVLTFDNREVIK